MIIELTSEDAQDFDIQLGGVELIFKLDWNERAQSWFLGVYDQDETPILASVRLLVGDSLLNHNQGKLPEGVLLLIHSDGELDAPNHDNLGQYFFEYLIIDEYVQRLMELV